MKLLQDRLKNSTKHLSVSSLLVISTLISGSAFADNSNNAFPSMTTTQQNKAVNKNTTQSTPATTHINRAYQPMPRYYVLPQQAYNPATYYYYYPQQQTATYYPQQQMMQAYPRYQATPSTRGAQSAYYQQQQRPHYQNNRAPQTLSTPKYPMRKKIKKEKKAWGDERHIWPDFYTDFTGDAWDQIINAPFDVGRMPGGWRAPSLSTPDPVTVGDAVANQIPPIMEEAGNMTHFVK
jgi:hypothetical protein